MDANELEASLRASMLKPGDSRLNPARPLTNGGKIRNMTDKALAEYLSGIQDPYAVTQDTPESWLIWLESESV